METILSVLITAGLGTWLAYVWQQRSAKQDRYFNASKIQYDQMRDSARTLAGLIGSRLYATNRMCLITPSSDFFGEAKEDFRQSVIYWNKSLLQVEIDIRTLFNSSSLVIFEDLQAQLVEITNKVSARVSKILPEDPPSYDLVREIAVLRGAYFQFLQGMVREAEHLFRQTHFGVVLRYSRDDISRYSTYDLIKVLLQGSEQESAVLRSPTDFGLPVSSRDARLGVNQQ